MIVVAVKASGADKDWVDDRKRLGTKKPPSSEQGGYWGDQSQVFPCFHCGGSQLLTNRTYPNSTRNKPLVCGFKDWHIKESN